MKQLFRFLICLMTVQLVHAQQAIKLDVQFLPTSDTVDWQGGPYIVIYDCAMTSDTSDPFDGLINIRRRSNADTSLRVAQVPLTNFALGDTVHFSWHDTIFAIDSLPYHWGDNVAQLWIMPDSAASYAPDTVTTRFYIRDLVFAVESPALASRLAVYPNPARQNLYLDFKEDAHKLRALQLTNLQGQVLLTASSAAKSLDLSGLPVGMYLLNVRYNDGLRGSFRVLHE
jgi:hypothetical protein